MASDSLLQEGVKPLSCVAFALFVVLAAARVSAAAQNPPPEQAHFAKLVLLQLNRVRSNPAAYADYLTTLRSRYEADGVYARPGEASIRTREGVAALNEAIAVLRNTPPLVQFAACEPLAQSAREFAAEQARSGGIGHGSSPFQRLSRHGTWLDSAGENIAYGSTTPERVVVDLLIDDGEPQRGHRANILNNAFRVAGVGVDRHPRYGVVCVIDFAGGFEPR